MIASELQAELRAKYNPDGSKLRNIQLRMLDMLKYIDKVCVENNIKYWLSSGTCLGAVRHGGFIPWDDDVDIELLEKDYQRLIKYLLSNETEEFIVQTYENDPNYIMDFAKLRDKTTKISEVFGIDKFYRQQGLFIDIFRLSPSGSKILHYCCGRLRVLEFYIKKGGLKSKLFKLMFPIARSINNFIIGAVRPLDRIRCDGRLRHHLGVTFLAPRYADDVKEVIRVPFEGLLLPIPSGYDSYLKSIYGDYMEMRQEHVHIKS